METLYDKIYTDKIPESDLKLILSDVIQKRNTDKLLCFKVETIDFGKYAILLSNRIGVSCKLIIPENKKLFLNLFNFWASTSQIRVRVEPFYSLVIRCLFGLNAKSNIPNCTDIPSDFFTEVQGYIKEKLTCLTKLEDS